MNERGGTTEEGKKKRKNPGRGFKPSELKLVSYVREGGKDGEKPYG